MVRKRTGIVPVILAALTTLGGCATAGSMAGNQPGSKIYAGTRLDATMVSEALSYDSEAAKTPGVEGPVLAWSACCGMADLPLSFIADTVMLPVTVPLELSKSRDPQPSSPAPSNDKPNASLEPSH
jgi:uncharacterized protein YceK